MDVVDKIAARRDDRAAQWRRRSMGDVPSEPVIIKSVRRKAKS